MSDFVNQSSSISVKGVLQIKLAENHLLYNNKTKILRYLLKTLHKIMSQIFNTNYNASILCVLFLFLFFFIST